MSIEDIMKTCRPVHIGKTNKGDHRCFFEDEINKILYIFGPSKYIRTGYAINGSGDIEVLEFEDGPYIGLGEEVLANKFAVAIGITYEEGLPLVTINYENEPIKKKKKKRKNK